MKRLFLSLLTTITLISCQNKQQNSTSSVQETKTQDSNATLFYGGTIITMEKEGETTEAVVTQNGEIAFTGSLADAQKAFPNAKKHDLHGETMMPGFIEPHVHPSIAATMLPNEIIAPYDWVLPTETKKGVSGHDAYIDRITKSIHENAKENEMYFIWGYHPLWHGELSRDILNKISPDIPVGIIHRSFHEIYLNDKAIEKLGITEEDFKGNPQVEWEKGHFFEGGWLALVPKMAPILLEPNRYMKGLGIMTQLIQKNGITTIAEPDFPSSDFDGEYSLLKKEMDKNPPYSCYLIPNGTQLRGMKGGDDKAMAFMETLPETYNTSNITFLPKQVKLFADGAIYSQLMQMKEPYTDGHHGEWMTPPNELLSQLKQYWTNDYKIHIHTNGDLAVDGIIMVVDSLQKYKARKDHRFTGHHLGYFSDAQAQRIADLGMEASVNPYYLWALSDKYAEHGLGKDRAENLERIKSLTDRQVPVSFHSDFSMAPIEPLTLAWTAINRITSQGSKFSQDQRIDVYTAMKAITLDAARTLNLENKIGSIKKGKEADFVILKENPFTIDPVKIKDITILGTVYKGQFHPNKANNLKK
ncbi:hypothetical protein UJ101_00070 [Flavobacteriaceae bacterium UJ101]|nr:hypothetical protein UJ101_00070 [Flavobacteriaceae bacterium UJ101]